MTSRLLPLAAGVLAIAASAPSRSAPPVSLPESPVVQAAAPGQFDWPQWRGPNRDGKSAETGLLQSWPADGPPKVWTVAGLGQGFGTPTVVAGKIYVMGAVDKKDGVFCLNEADGKQVWFTPFDDAREARPNLGPGSQPTYHAGKLYAVSNKGTVAALDAASGKVLWTRSYPKEFGGKGGGGWGYNDSVLVDGDKVICAPSGEKAAVVALKAATGETIWKTEVGAIGGGAGYSSPVKMTVGSIPTYVQLLGDQSGVVGVHAETGKLLWQYKGQGVTGSTAQIPTPVIYQNRVWASDSYGKTGGAALLQLTPNGTEKIDVEALKTYTKPELNNHHGGMILVGKHVYFGHNQNAGIPACVDITTGAISYKEDREPKGAGGSVAITYADGRLYYRYQNHLMALVEPNPKEFKLVSSFKLPEPSGKESWAHPVVANGRLYIHDQDKLHCFNVKAATN